MGRGARAVVSSARAPALTFRRMEPADLPEVLEIERLSFPQPWTPGLFLHELKLDFSRLHVARWANGGERLAGYACWWVVGDEAHILNLAVRPDYRRGGVGRALAEHVLADAAARGAASVSLEVRDGNGPAAALYRALGFAPIGRRRNYYAPGEDAVIMEWRAPHAA